MQDQPETTTTEITQPEPPTPPEVRFADNGKSRERAVPLDWPLLVDGKEMSSITVRRLNGSEMIAFQEAMKEEAQNGDGSDGAMLEHFTGVSAHVLNCLDADDLLALKDAVFDFLPKTMRAGIEQEMARSQLPDS
ncbi:phage tail assembly protein [Halocynthiibacter styelae]|uniref:Phage tail assembly protein n=1 Tax=Halocynthiibacter styelae TaxID=2761955 RepID=A0A8J7LX76_9RHOB|nr:phage tail assembly protein [Paenihalocynthiibacter styelae]MBI1495412.1 phage tail assembly protein [Paenihalocynthiibacter styelae]